MRHDVDDALFHQSAEADGGFAVICEDQEGAAVWDEAAIKCEAVHQGGHAVFADAVIEVAAVVLVFGDGLLVVGFGVVGTCEVCRTANHLEDVFV